MMKDNLLKLKKHYMSYFISNFVPLVLNLITIYIFTSIISPAQYGEYNINLTTYTIITMFMFEWIGHGILRFLPKYDEESGNVFYGAFRYLAYLTLIMMILYLVLIMMKAIYITNVLIVGILYILTSGLIIIANSIIKSKLKTKVFLNCSLLQSIIYSIFSCSLLLIYKNYIYILIAKIISNSIGIIFISNNCSLFKKNNFKGDTVLKEIESVFLYGFPIILTGIGAMGLKIGDRYIIQYFLGGYHVGLYTSNYMISENITMILFGPIMIASHPILISLYENNKIEELKKMIIQIKKVVLLVFIPIIMYIFVYYENTSLVFVSKSFMKGSFIIPIVLFGSFLYNYSLYNLKIYEFKLQSIKITKIILLCFIINIILNILLIKSFGITGAAIATTICYILFFIISRFVSNKENFLNEIELDYKIKLLLTNLLLGIFWVVLRHISLVNANNISYLGNLLFVILSSIPVFIIYIFINLKLLKIKI